MEAQESLEQNENLSIAVADQLSENVVGTFSLPYSVVPEVLVNGQEYTVPYVTEEPSVVAAASFASKIIKTCGWFYCSGSSTPNDWSGSSLSGSR